MFNAVKMVVKMVVVQPLLRRILDLLPNFDCLV